MSVRLLDGDERITVQDDQIEGVTGGDPETTYTLRPIAPDVRRTFVSKHTKDVINGRTGARERVTDHDALVDDLFDHALESWTGILLKGEAAPCTRDNKLRLDFPRKQALLRIAGVNQSGPIDRGHSFRPPR